MEKGFYFIESGDQQPLKKNGASPKSHTSRKLNNKKMKSKKRTLSTIVFSVLIGLGNVTIAQTFCNPTGNVIIFSNYDGGVLRINVDKNIPNIKIGIVSYENDSVIISGTYAGNVTKVVYAGYNTNDNFHCTPRVKARGVYGVSPSIVSILFSPPATLSSPTGHNKIVCSHECSNKDHGGGCNTSDQIVDYFNTTFGTVNSNVYFHLTQYQCWTITNPLETFKISDGGNCCILSPRTQTNVEDKSIEDNITVSPNPSDGHLRLSGKSLYKNLNIYSSVGTILFSKNLKEYELTNELDISMLPKGVYFLELSDEQHRNNAKIIIQ